MPDYYLNIPRRLCVKPVGRSGIWTLVPFWTRSLGLSVLTEPCACLDSPPCFPTVSLRYAAPPQTLINHSSRWVTFALFKKILQTVAFRKYNYLPFYVSAANIPALWAVYLMVFVYRLTFLLYFHFGQIEMAVCAWLCESVSGKGNIWCAFYDVAIEILATVNMNRLSSLSHRACHLTLMTSSIFVFSIFDFSFPMLQG